MTDENKKDDETAAREASLSAPVCSALRPMTLHTLRDFRDHLKQHALYVGRYPPLYTPENYDARDKSKAFRSMGYNETVRRINAIDEVIQYLSANAELKGDARKETNE
jgi:hypothetical protein